MPLRALEPEDLGLLYTIENDPEIWDVSTCSVGAAPYSRYALKEYIARSVESDLFTSGEQRFVIEEEGRAVGTIDLTRFSPINLTAEVGIALLHESRGKGLASRALQELEQYAATRLRLRALVAYIPAALTPASLQLFQRAGYEPVGRLHAWHYARCAYHDVHILQKLLV